MPYWEHAVNDSINTNGAENLPEEENTKKENNVPEQIEHADEPPATPTVEIAPEVAIEANPEVSYRRKADPAEHKVQTVDTIMTGNDADSIGNYMFVSFEPFYKNHFLITATDSSSTQITQISLSTEQEPLGKEGIIRPFSCNMSDGIIFLMLVSFFLFASVYTKGASFVAQIFQNLIGNTERDSIFVDSTTGSEERFKFFLILQTSILLSIFFFIENNILYERNIFLSEKTLILAIGFSIVILLAFWAIKWIINKALGYIFFDNQIIIIWQNNYFSAIGLLGIALYPVLLILVYSKSEIFIYSSLYILWGIILIGFISITLKGIRFFLLKPHGIFYYLLYLCALEIIPYVGLYHGLMHIYNYV
ncbi:MAG: DUF4271 domain-containing protein [Bacteroidales bacterium]|jgi:hypothetical protein|nr:DUF4271 domain-containing protein [Bacteroidales bacterium]